MDDSDEMRALPRKQSGERNALAIGGLSAVLASTCCLGPLILASIGLSGAWIAQLTRLEPFRPLFLIVASVALAFAGYRIYRRTEPCEPGVVCATPAARRGYKVLFWVVAALALIAFVYPCIAPWFY